MELSPEEKQQRGENYALYLLGRQDYTCAKLREKICQKHPEADPDKIINRLIELGYLNDERFAERYVQSLLGQKMGVSKIKQKMYVKGFPRQIIDSVSNMENVQEHDFRSDALALKLRAYGEDPITDQKEKQRAINKLLRKGFSFDVAKYAVEARVKEEY